MVRLGYIIPGHALLALSTDRIFRLRQHPIPHCQLMISVVPTLAQLKTKGEQGRNRYTRYMTVSLYERWRRISLLSGFLPSRQRRKLERVVPFTLCGVVHFSLRSYRSAREVRHEQQTRDTLRQQWQQLCGPSNHGRGSISTSFTSPDFCVSCMSLFYSWFTLTGSDLRGRPLKVYLSNQGDHGELPHNSCAMLYPAHASTEEAEP